ncbi:MAG TPA: TMEM175 family protein [Methanobacteriaceae archaeon]|nr:TMEM175 family protein [Methanobacteriaceae archaeon]
MVNDLDSIYNWMTTSRIETLVDGIFAIAMTLLVLSIAVPDISRVASESALQQQLWLLWPKILSYVLSFWILSMFWRVNHQQFYFIKRTNPALITINVCWLLFIVLVPFSTDLIGDYPNYFTANLIFQLNLFFAGILYYVNWFYAVRKGLLDEKMDKTTIQLMSRNNLIFPILSIIALGLAYYVDAWSSLVYLASPLLKKIMEKI